MSSGSCFLSSRGHRSPRISVFIYTLALLAGSSATISAAATAQPAPVLPPAAQREVDFAKDIQPMLADRCYSCHGPEKQKADLRWDSKASVFKGGENGPVLVPGKSTESRVVHLVAGLEPDSIMPPKGDRLTDEQIGLLRAWIDQGANWPEALAGKIEDKSNHWGFKAPVRPPVPATTNEKWSRNAIDRFILARLEKENFAPSPETDRITLIRRLSLDLTGLPPTLKEVDDLLADQAPDAYERLVERLLASPHYGERWGRHWLDAARYADTNGYEKDRPRSIWPYRDWVISVVNRDLPFDEFVIEQLAGDLLPNPTREQQIATGFLRNAMLNQEGGIEPEQFRVEALVDRMDTLGKALLGLTISCAQCHNHKYDPFSQKEYYELYAFLNNDYEAFLEAPTAEQEKKRAEILSQVRNLEETAMRQTHNLNELMATWEKGLPGSDTNWLVLDPKEWINFGTKFEKLEDLSLLGGGDLQPGGIMRVWIDTTLTNITGFRLEAFTNLNLMYGGPGEVGRGSFLVKEFTVEAYPLDKLEVTNKIKFRRAIADAEAPSFAVTNAIDGNTEKGGWTPTATPERRNQNHTAVFECEEPFGFPGGTRLLITLHQTYKGDEKNGAIDADSKLDCHLLGCFRLSATTNAGPLTVDPLSPVERQHLAMAADQRTPEQKRELFTVFRLGNPTFTNLNQQISNLWTNWPYPPTTMVLHQREKPRVTHVFKRGDRLRPDEEVQPATPAVLHPFPADAPRNRLGLAKWIIDPASPTTARVIVNRIWQAYFGQGLVTSPED
ncbi:MAG TPA: DUF1549 domain-containing protein, partial [Clostridia bacterium]|nr:DUF1549 domain-containing protein [Clostridia bacterium]